MMVKNVHLFPPILLQSEQFPPLQVHEELPAGRWIVFIILYITNETADAIITDAIIKSIIVSLQNLKDYQLEKQ
jgi:hypothetical protein